MIHVARLIPAVRCAALCVGAFVSPIAAQQATPSSPVAGAARPASRPAAAPAIRAAPRAAAAAVAARGANPSGPFARLNEIQRDSVIENTRSLLGIRYKWAGASPERGVDCSGLVRYVFAKFGIDVPHSAALLARLGMTVARDTADMRPGDLLVFSKAQSKRISHVGIYVGDGMMVHASSTSREVVETPILEYRGLLLRGVRRVFSVDSSAAGGDTRG